MPRNRAWGLARAWRIARRYGLGEVWWRLLHRLRLISVHHALTIWGYELRKELPSSASAGAARREKLVLREAAAPELPQLRWADGLGDFEEHQQRINRGSRMFVAAADGLVVCVNFIHPKVAELSYLNHPALPLLDARAFYLHGAETAPAYRRQGIASALRMFVLRTLKAEGYDRGLLATLPDNDAAEMYNYASGFRPWARITWLRWRNRNIWRTRLTPAGQGLQTVLRFSS